MKHLRFPLLLLGCVAPALADPLVIHDITYTSAMGPQSVGFIPGGGLLAELQTDSTVIVESSAIVTYAPRQKITLRPGFWAKTGSFFNAFIYDGPGSMPASGSGSSAPFTTRVSGGADYYTLNQSGTFVFTALDADSDLTSLQVAWLKPGDTTPTFGSVQSTGTPRFGFSFQSTISFDRIGVWKVWVKATDALSHVRNPGDVPRITYEIRSIIVTDAPAASGLNIHRPSL
jgi:hypothetical protein